MLLCSTQDGSNDSVIKLQLSYVNVNVKYVGPIENLWHELKEYIRRVVKPKTKDELVNGILRHSGLLLM